MPSFSARQQFVTAAAVLLGASCLIVLWRWLGPGLIEEAYAGHGVWPLSELFAHRKAQRPDEFTLERALALVRAGTFALGLAGVLGVCGVLAWARRAALIRALSDFARAPGSPISLAIFRIVIFALVLTMVSNRAPKMTFMAGLPDDLIVPPFGLGPVLEVVPITPGLAGGAVLALKIACVCGIVGLFSRTSALVACVCAIYAFGIPQLFGKVNHHQHLVWFLAILAASPCADVLSVDAVIRALRRGPKGDVEPPAPSAGDGLPLRLVWVLIGFIYFFPGMWKLLMVGPEWILGDAMQHVLWRKWQDKEFLPSMRIDQWPLAYRAMGAAAIVFEIGFLPAILFRRTRMVAVPVGFAFHILTRIFMRIRFTALLWCYVAFIPWDRVFGWIGRRLFPEPMLVAFDGNCGLCRRTAAAVGTIDILRRIEFVPSQDGRVRAHPLLGAVPEADLLRDIHGASGGRVRSGYDMYRVMAWRLPLLWWLAALMHLWPVTAIGRSIYRRVADNRACLVGEGRAPLAPPTPRRLPRAVVVVGAILVGGNGAMGLLAIGDAWPLAAYPGFAATTGPERWKVRIEFVDAGGEVLTIRRRDFPPGFPPNRWARITSHIAATKDDAVRERRIRALWDACVRARPKLAEVREVRVTRERLLLDPDAGSGVNPLEERPVATFDLRPDGRSGTQ